ncbi:MAG: Uma2 family endonuclease [Bacteroidia bacterium]|nr:Uma2 family endonuclease [Bacteroidia bacterium]
MAYPLPDLSDSWEAYQKLEARSEERYEYHDGETVAMSGASNRHNKLIARLIARMLPAAERAGCEVFMESVRLFRHRSDRYLYPDIVSTCHPLDLQTKNGVRSPWLIVEVLSESSTRKDLGFKMLEYFKLPSLRHYIVIAQDLRLVHHYQRQEGGRWLVELLSEPDETLVLPEWGLALSLAELYAGIQFGPEPSEAEEAAMFYGETGGEEGGAV